MYSYGFHFNVLRGKSKEVVTVHGEEILQCINSNKFLKREYRKIQQRENQDRKNSGKSHRKKSPFGKSFLRLRVIIQT